MAQSLQNNETDHLWPTSLILTPNPKQFACINCNGIPKTCTNNQNGDIFCSECSKHMDDIEPNKTVQRMINALETRCLSIIQDPNQQQNEYLDEGAEGSNVLITNNIEQCDWNGTIQQYQKHAQHCLFIVIQCECKAFKSQRRLMQSHINECPRVSLNCPLSCGLMILRKDMEHHLDNECGKQLVFCPNDDCKMQIERNDLKYHVEHECESRNCECPFKKFGCNVINIKGNELQQHIDDYKYEHKQYEFDRVTSQLNGEIFSLKTQLLQHQLDKEQDNKEIERLKEKNLELKYQINILYEQLAAQNRLSLHGNMNDEDSDDSLGAFVVK